jgi:soluble lytic murein transglycosylase-like protein
VKCIRGILAISLCLAAATAIASPPGAERYRSEVTREAKFQWGINAPVRTFAAQIHQESGWRADARSAYASGLTQFTPDTAKWIAGAYPRTLGEGQPLNPSWAIRALVTYDLHLYNRIKAETGCERMAMALSAYNGGLGWVQRDQKLTVANGGDPARWFGQVERFSPRSVAAFKENRDYPRKILQRWQAVYASWGAGVDCRTAA